MSPTPAPAQENQEEDQVILVEEMTSVDLRILLRQHALIIFGCAIVLVVAFLMPSDVSWIWWIPRVLLGVPSAFVGFIRLTQLNGVLDELRRRAQGERPSRQNTAVAPRDTTDSQE